MATQFDNNLSTFLTHAVEIRRIGGFTVNDYGEVVPNAESLIATTTMRIEPARSKSLTTMLQGKEVLITHKGFAKSTEDVRENDRIKVVATNTEYIVGLVNAFYDEASLDHLELFLKEVDNL